jgi:hypothetical protein
VTYLIAEQLEKRPVIYATAITYGLLLGLQPFFHILVVIPIAGFVGLCVGAYLEYREVVRISHINLHDKVLKYGDLKTAKNANTRVRMQEAQAKQLNQIQDAVDENRPVYLDDMEILGDPNENAEVEPLELVPIPTV